MALTEEEIRKGMARAFHQKPVSILAEVKSVDSNKRTCDIDDNGVIIYGVRLQPISQGATGVTIYPKVGAQVICLRIEDEDNYMVVHSSDFDKMEIKVSDKSVVIDKDGIVINNGSIGSVKADKMVEWMTKVYDDLQTLVALLSASIVTGNGAPLGITFTPTTPSPVLSNFEDNAFKH